MTNKFRNQKFHESLTVILKINFSEISRILQILQKWFIIYWRKILISTENPKDVANNYRVSRKYQKRFGERLKIGMTFVILNKH